MEDKDNTRVSKAPRLIMRKADWAKFYNLTYIIIPADVIEAKTVNELVDQFNENIMQAAPASMVMSSKLVMPRRVPWWTQESTLANK